MHDITTRITPTNKTLDALRSRTLEDLRRIAPDHLGQPLSTEELARLFGVQAATIRRAHCMNGHYLGLRPTKLNNGRLRWTVA